jgi:hypothetical protein
MGFTDWMARKGNVGGTARAVAKAWKTIKLRNPEMNNQEIAETYISIRYGATKEPQLAIRAGLEKLDSDISDGAALQ